MVTLHKFLYFRKMEYKTFKRYVRMAGLEIKEFAGFIGVNHRSISNYSRQGRVPEHLAIIVFMMVELSRLDVDIKDVFAKLDRSEKQSHAD